jgi:hypothetical protein
VLDLVYYLYDAPILLLTVKEVCKKTLSTASSPMAIGCLPPRINYPKNSKLTPRALVATLGRAFKQLSFFNGEFLLSVSSVDVSMGVTR